MPLSFSASGILACVVGRTPWSARVPLDPLFSGRIKYLPASTSRPGGRLRTRGSAPPIMRAPGNGKTRAHWECLPARGSSALRYSPPPVLPRDATGRH